MLDFCKKKDKIAEEAIYYAPSSKCWKVLHPPPPCGSTPLSKHRDPV